VRYAYWIGLSLIGYVGGVAGYAATLAIVWKQSIGGDLEAVLFWGGLAYVLIAIPLFVFTFWAIDRVRSRRRGMRRRPPALLYPAAAALEGPGATYFIMRVWGGGASSLLEPEAIPFHTLFAVAGIIWGTGWWMLIARKR
jgi:hypothetical protein